MAKTRTIILLCSMFLATASLNCFADELTAKVSALEDKAKHIQGLIDQAKATNADALKNQVTGLRSSVDALVKQRVLIDSQIAQVENQMADVKKQSQANLDRQIGNYAEDLVKIKSQLTGLIDEAKKQTKSSPQAAAPTVPNAAAAQAPAAK